MPHTAIEDLTTELGIQAGSVVSKVIHKDEQLDVTVFGFDAGEGLTEHTAQRPAIVQVLSGRMRFVVEGEGIDASPGTWIHMAADTSHSLSAVEPTMMLLTLLPR
jgi:quercetin dioxygenase-like cupin family protein